MTTEQVIDLFVKIVVPIVTAVIENKLLSVCDFI